MNSWAKYVVGFFAFILVLSALIFAFGPREHRDAFWSRSSPVGQLPSDAHLENSGQSTSDTATEPAKGTASGTSQPADER